MIINSPIFYSVIMEIRSRTEYGIGVQSGSITKVNKDYCREQDQLCEFFLLRCQFICSNEFILYSILVIFMGKLVSWTRSNEVEKILEINSRSKICCNCKSPNPK